MDLDDFDIDSATLGAWQSFTTNLTEVLSVMDESSDLTISVARGLVDGGDTPAIRFSARDEIVTARILSGWSVPGKADPSDEERPLLLELGWAEVPEVDATYYTARCDQEETEPLAVLAAATLREVFEVLHPVFLEPDQLKEILRGSATWQSSAVPARSQDVAIMPANRAELDRIVDQQLEKIFGHPSLRNPDGDVAIRVGSTMLFLRSTQDAGEIVLFSPLVHDVAGRSRAAEVLNDLNVESRYGRFALHRDRVFVQVSVPARPFVPAHLHQALRIMSQIADGIDDDLADRLGGRTTFPNQLES